MSIMAPTLHRLNAGNYCTSPIEATGSYVACRYFDPNKRHTDGWMVSRWELNDLGNRDLVSRQWTRTLADARAEIAFDLRMDEAAA
jgi:hypothetical protein